MNIKPLFLGRLAVPTITLAMGVGGGPQPHGSQRAPMSLQVLFAAARARVSPVPARGLCLRVLARPRKWRWHGKKARR